MSSNALTAVLMLVLIVMVLGIVVGNCISDRAQHDVSKTTLVPSTTTTTTTTPGECLCVFDVDRTLTGKQEETAPRCPGNTREEAADFAPGGAGRLTVSQLAQALDKTFCAKCYLGAISESSLGDDEERRLIHLHLARNHEGQPLPENQEAWGSGCDAEGKPLITNCAQGKKQTAVPNILKYYSSKGVNITDGQVFFFDDVKENIDSFGTTKYNAKQISCEIRDNDAGGIGLCGATVDEIGNARFNGFLPCNKANASDEALWV
jgi:hypothetical protein